MKKTKYLKIGVIISIISTLGGVIYWKLTKEPLTSKKISDILFIEFLLLFTLGSFMYFKEKFWSRPWKKLKKEEAKKEKNRENKSEIKTKEKVENNNIEIENKAKAGLKLMLISFPMVVISILITLL